MSLIKYVSLIKEEILVVNTYFPRRILYWWPLWKVVKTFSARSRIQQMSEVEDFLVRHPEYSSVIAECVQTVLGGYSVTPARGRYLRGDDDAVDENVWIVQIIVRPTSGIPIPVDEYFQIAGVLIHHLIGARLATKTRGQEEEIWMTSWIAVLWIWSKETREE